MATMRGTAYTHVGGLGTPRGPGPNQVQTDHLGWVCREPHWSISLPLDVSTYYYIIIIWIRGGLSLEEAENHGIPAGG